MLPHAMCKYAGKVKAGECLKPWNCSCERTDRHSSFSAGVYAGCLRERKQHYGQSGSLTEEK